MNCGATFARSVMSLRQMIRVKLPVLISIVILTGAVSLVPAISRAEDTVAPPPAAPAVVIVDAPVEVLPADAPADVPIDAYPEKRPLKHPHDMERVPSSEAKSDSDDLADKVVIPALPAVGAETAPASAAVGPASVIVPAAMVPPAAGPAIKVPAAPMTGQDSSKNL